MAETVASFVPFATFVDTAFWNQVNKRKLDEWKLDETAKPLNAQISLYDSVGNECRLSLGHECFDAATSTSACGKIVLFNTIDTFKKLDRAQLLQNEGKEIWDRIQSGQWLDDPWKLTTFTITVFADLKKFQYYYWNCFPALCFPHNIRSKVVSTLEADASKLLLEVQRKLNCAVFALINGEPTSLQSLKTMQTKENFKLVVIDPSTVQSTPGWPLRNILAAVAYTKPTWNSLNVVCLRGAMPTVEFAFSWDPVGDVKSCDLPRVVGWETHRNGKLQPYAVDLKRQFDPKTLMEQSVNLNLSLIKWRLVPELRLERFSNTKALIFGAGTLGCNIARNLMGWGVKRITFIDNSTVSYSNPVRQSLSEFNDAVQARPKAVTAADALRRINPNIEAESVILTVPMPGHTVSETGIEELKTTVERLEELVESHDVLFLALDSREARWLPTVLANKYGKMAFSVALGFDTFVVIRHGVTGEDSDTQTDSADDEMASYSIRSNAAIPYRNLACYFCSDVTAPGNSTTDRTLDQQCTVSRPGLSMIASGVAVELLASVLQHPEPLSTPANIGEPDDSSSLLGATPHQIRGFVFKFQQMTPCIRRFDRCVACGAAVLNEFKSRGAQFVFDVANSPSYLEKLTGLDQLQNSVDDVQIDFSDDGDSVISI